MAKSSSSSVYEIGDLVWVNFPYEEDSSKAKERLALIIDKKGKDYLCAKITTSIKKLSQYAIPLPAPPCIKDSYVDLAKLASFQVIHFRGKQSALNTLQLKLILNEFKKITP